MFRVVPIGMDVVVYRCVTKGGHKVHVCDVCVMSVMCV